MQVELYLTSTSALGFHRLSSDCMGLPLWGVSGPWPARRAKLLARNAVLRPLSSASLLSRFIRRSRVDWPTDVRGLWLGGQYSAWADQSGRGRPRCTSPSVSLRYDDDLDHQRPTIGAEIGLEPAWIRDAILRIVDHAHESSA